MATRTAHRHVNRRTPRLLTSMIALPVLALLAVLPAAAQGQNWSGWARCGLDLKGPGYHNWETHTWIVTRAVSDRVDSTR